MMPKIWLEAITLSNRGQRPRVREQSLVSLPGRQYNVRLIVLPSRQSRTLAFPYPEGAAPGFSK